MFSQSAPMNGCLFGKITEGEMHLNDAGLIVAEEWLKTPVIRAEIELDEWVVMAQSFSRDCGDYGCGESKYECSPSDR